MTHLAWRGGRDMPLRLANRHEAIVTRGADRPDLRMINGNYVAPSGRDVARFAFVCDARMVYRHAGRHRAIVAAEALLRRRLEASGDMTGFALRLNMGAGQRKSGLGVVERGLWRLNDPRIEKATRVLGLGGDKARD